MSNTQSDVSQINDIAVTADPTIDLFDMELLRLKLPQEAVAVDEADCGFEIDLRPRRVSDEQLNWEARIAEIVRDPRGSKRQLVVATQSTLDHVERLRAACPGLETVIDLVLRACHLSMATGSPLRLPPLLLVGPPGIGKTHFARRLAAALGVPAKFIAMDMLSDRGSLTGLNLSWRGARPGKIAEALLAANVASPLIILDEADKVSAIHMHEEPLAFLHTMLEPENAEEFTDEYLMFPMRADHCFWLLTANDERALPPAIVDRLLVLRVPEPAYVTMLTISGNIYQAANAQLANWFEIMPDETILAVLARCNPRRAKRILELAMGFTARAGRRVLAPSDIEAASILVDESNAVRGKAGFVPSKQASRPW